MNQLNALSNRVEYYGKSLKLAFATATKYLSTIVVANLARSFSVFGSAKPL